MARGAEHLGGAAFLDDATEIHHRDAVADLAHHGEVVADEEIGEAAPGAQRLQHVEDLRLDGDIEGGGGFVEHQQVGFQRQGAGDADALLLTAGKFVREAVQERRGQADLGEQRGDPVAQRLAGGDAVDAQGFGDGVLGRQARVERGGGVLVDELHAPAQWAHRCFVERGDVAAVEDDAAVGERDEAQQQAREGGFAAAAFADDAERGTAVEREVEFRHRAHLRRFVEQAATAFEAARQAFGAEQRFGHGVAWWQATLRPGSTSRRRGFS